MKRRIIVTASQAIELLERLKGVVTDDEFEIIVKEDAPKIECIIHMFSHDYEYDTPCFLRRDTGVVVNPDVTNRSKRVGKNGSRFF